MKVTLRDVIPEEALEAEVEAFVGRILDRVITLDMKYEGTPVPRRLLPPDEPIVCPECGQTDFTTTSALGGHRFHKHGIRKNFRAEDLAGARGANDN